jgi:hypothetical protein
MERQDLDPELKKVARRWFGRYLLLYQEELRWLSDHLNLPDSEAQCLDLKRVLAHLDTELQCILGDRSVA